jgi:hypothetical protein
MRAIAARARVHPDTFYKWNRIAEFKRWFNNQMLADAETRTGPAVMVLIRTWENPDNPDEIRIRAARDFLNIFKPSIGEDMAALAAISAVFTHTGPISATVETADLRTGKATRAHVERGTKLGAVTARGGGSDPAAMGAVAAATQIIETVERERAVLVDMNAGLQTNGPARAPTAQVIGGDSPGEDIRP